MKLIILTSTLDRHRFFAAQLLDVFPDALVVLEPKDCHPPPPQPRNAEARQARARRYAERDGLNRQYAQALEAIDREKQAAERFFFARGARRFDALYSDRVAHRLEAGGAGLNSPETRTRLRELEPDLIAVMGTSLLKKRLIQIPSRGILNLHTGLSPYYRGGMTVLWPMINGEPRFCGVTLHRLSAGIDSGDILYHGLPNWQASDNFSTINCKLIVLGSALMVRAIGEVAAGESRARAQWCKGRLYNNIDYDGSVAQRYLDYLDSGQLASFALRVQAGQVQFPDGLQLCRDPSLEQYLPAKTPASPMGGLDG